MDYLFKLDDSYSEAVHIRYNHLIIIIIIGSNIKEAA